MRTQRSLAGIWQFQLDPQGVLTVDRLAPDRQIPVPMPWQAAFPELREYDGYAWYKHSVVLDERWLEGELLLTFGAVDYRCEVYVNGQLAGQHEGGYTPFTLPIRSHATPGENEIAVRVYDPVQSGITIPRWPAFGQHHSRPHYQPTLRQNPESQDIPHGKQEWYINVGGIWQDVTLSAVPATYIDYVHVTPDIRSGRARLTVQMAGAPAPAGEGEKGGGQIEISIQAEGVEVARGMVPVQAGRSVYSAELTVAQPRLWSPDDPYLYTAVVKLQIPSGEDEVDVRFGFRQIAVQDGRILLNGQPIFLLCALDQDLYPDTIYTVPSEQFLRDQFLKAKQLGLNSLRCHIKPPDPLYLDLADEIGLLIWAEIPSWRTFHLKGTLHPDQIYLDPTVKQRVERTLEEMVRRDFNHPSLVIWTIVNEDWGTSLPFSADDRAWVASMYERCKQLDPTRLVVDNSPCLHSWGPNIHVLSDLDDFHIYANIPEHALWFEQSIEQLNLRPLWTYSGFGDARRTGQEPLVLSEFGNWGLPSVSALRAHYGADPPWFDLGAWWSPWEGEPSWPGPGAVEERFRRFGLDAIWGDFERFAQATQWHQFEAMKFQIEVVRRQPNLAGYVITEFTDAYWESNGLLDFARNPKAYYQRFSSINAPDMVIAKPDRYAMWDDEQLTVRLYASHYSSADWTGARLRLAVNDGGLDDVQVPALSTGEVGALGVVSISLNSAPVEQASTARLSLTLVGDGDVELARNTLDLLVLPASMRQAAQVGEVVVWPSQEANPALSLQPALEELGYQVRTQLSPDSRVAVSNYPDAHLLQWVRQGGDLLFICSGPSPFFWAQGRSGAYSGSWISSFSWLRPQAHRRLGTISTANPLGLPFMNVMPMWTVLGLPVDHPRYHQDFLSGMVLGWVRHPAVHTVQFRYGRGRVVMTTFAIREGLQQRDPVAVALLHDLIEHLCSDRCRPALTANY
jgi:hypothetical protein